MCLCQSVLPGGGVLRKGGGRQPHTTAGLSQSLSDYAQITPVTSYLPSFGSLSVRGEGLADGPQRSEDRRVKAGSGECSRNRINCQTNFLDSIQSRSGSLSIWRYGLSASQSEFAEPVDV
jgi:hypothetical protein